MPNTLSLQHMRVTSGYLNGVNDAAPGTNVGPITGGIAQSYAGLVGGKLVLDGNEALKMSNTTIGTLYGGIYQYVRVLSSATLAAVRGQACYWTDRENYVVTTDPTATNCSKFAGVFINVITKGNYGFIQIAGKASLLCKAALTKAAADGDLIVVDGATTPTFDTLADATSLTSVQAKLIIGQWLEVPGNGLVKLGEIQTNRNVY